MSSVYMDRASYQTLDATGVKRLIDRHMLAGADKYHHLQEYYLGNHDILHSHKEHSASPNNRIVCNVAKYITDTATGYFLGKPVVYGSSDDNYLAQLQDIMDYNDEQDHNAELAKGCSIKGSCCEMLYLDEDAAIRMTLLEPDDCLVIYPTGSEEPMGAIRRIVTEDKDGNKITRYEWWREEDVWYFTAPDGGSLQLSGTEDHYWHGVPVVAGRYAAERLVRTECTHFAAEARLLAYKETGVKRYRFVGGGEGGHCDCATLNGQEFDIDTAKAGLDYPPIHPNCTCTIVAVPSRRMFAPYEAVPIPESIKYEDWYEDYVAHTQRPPRRSK